MKANRYFEKFPLVKYGSYYLRNILTRVRFPQRILRDYKNFYDYTMESGDRTIYIAHDYYDDLDFYWLVNIANQIVDPYYDIHMGDQDFKAFINKKYGSSKDALEKIIYYRNDWAADDSSLTTAAFDALNEGQKKYWDPVENAFGTVTSYVRKRVDYIVNTNIAGYMKFDEANNAVLLTETDDYETFSVGEKITRDDDSSTYAYVTWANTTIIRFQHVFGDFTSNTSYDITGDTSGVTATINSNSISLTDVIPSAERVYFSPVYAYDYEDEKNTENKELKLVENTYAVDLSEKLSNIL